MAITGHRTRSIFRRYNTIEEVDVLEAGRRLQTYLGRGIQQNHDRTTG